MSAASALLAFCAAVTFAVYVTHRRESRHWAAVPAWLDDSEPLPASDLDRAVRVLAGDNDYWRALVAQVRDDGNPEFYRLLADDRYATLREALAASDAAELTDEALAAWVGGDR